MIYQIDISQRTRREIEQLPGHMRQRIKRKIAQRVIAREGVQTLTGVAAVVHAWAPGKWQFTSSQIALAAERLDAQRWLSGQDRS